ncbi:hypothetical protein Tco_0731264 [Tanacetum coccineum]
MASLTLSKLSSPQPHFTLKPPNEIKNGSLKDSDRARDRMVKRKGFGIAGIIGQTKDICPDMGDDVDINTLTIEHYLALIQDNNRPGIVKPKIGDDVKFKINSNFMRELRRKLFASTDDEDAHEHSISYYPQGAVLRWKKRLLAGMINTWDLLEKEFIWQYCSPLSADVLSQAAVSASAGPSGVADKGKAPMPDLDIPAEFLAEDAQARQRLEEEQASARLVQQLQAEDLAQADVPLVSEQRAKELDELLLRMTDTDWLTLMMQVGTNPALARELLGADVNEDNFIERMTAIKERKKRALAELRYRALKGKPLKQSEVTKMMRNLVKNQWCAAHNGTITMKAVTAMSKQQLTEEYENICRRLEKDHLLSAQYNLFRPKPAITEPPSKRQRVERASSQPSDVPAATTQPADDPDSAGGSSFHPAGSTPMSGSAVPDTAGGPLDTTGTASTVPTSAAMDTAGSHRESGVSPFVDSDDSSSPSPVSTDHIPIDVLFDSTSGGLHEFFLASDEDAPIGMSRIAADPDSDDEVLAEILFRGQYISGAGVVVVDKLSDDEIIDPRVKVETVSLCCFSSFVEDFFSSESESDDDMETYIPPIPYGAFKDWEIVRCPLSNTYYHVYYQENRRQQSFFYLKELLPHVYREDLLLLRQRMNRTQEDLGGSSWKLYPKSSVHDVTPTGSQFTPLNCRRLLLLGVAVIQAIDSSAFTGESYECLAAAPMLPILRWYHFQIPVGMKNGLVQAQRLCWLSKDYGFVDMVLNPPWNLPFLGAKGLTSPEQTATGKGISNPLMAVMVCQKPYGIQLTNVSLVPADSSSSIPADDVPADSSSSIPADDVPAGSSSSVPAEYVSAGHIVVSADRDRIC